MILIWIVQFRLSDGQLITFGDQSIGNSLEEIKDVLDKVFLNYELVTRSQLMKFDYIIRFAN